MSNEKIKFYFKVIRLKDSLKINDCVTSISQDIDYGYEVLDQVPHLMVDNILTIEDCFIPAANDNGKFYYTKIEVQVSSSRVCRYNTSEIATNFCRRINKGEFGYKKKKECT